MTKEAIKSKAVILDGKKVSQDIKKEIAVVVEGIKKSDGKVPHLAAVLVGSDGASMTYVNSKVKDCEEVGFRSTKVTFHETVSEDELLKKIDEINADDDIDGLIVQLPLPKHISKKKVTERIAPEKDVDGFTAINYGRMASNLPSFISATPFGIMELLKRYNITTRGKHVVVVGRSHIVGAPTSILMARPGDATVTLCHRFTTDLEEHIKRADILVVAVGKPGMVTAGMIKEGAVIVDVGITRVEDASKKSGYSLKGDVDFDSVLEKCSYITPVPGGVGPMTRAGLLLNTLKAARVSFD